MNSTTAPKMPRIAAAKRRGLDILCQHGVDDPIVDWTDAEWCEQVGVTQKQLDGYRAYRRYTEANPLVLNPSFNDLPVHLACRSVFVTEDTAMENAYSRQRQTEAAAEGRTVWAGRSVGWVAPVA